MAELFHNADFWYTILIIAIIVFAFLIIKSYVKRLKGECCGSGTSEKINRIKISDRNKAHYPYIAILTIDGMVCSNCASKIENALNVLGGVWADADVNAKEVTVRMKQPIDEQLLRETVNSIGAYTVMKITKKL